MLTKGLITANHDGAEKVLFSTLQRGIIIRVSCSFAESARLTLVEDWCICLWHKLLRSMR
jgi:hypothetical protein